MLESLAETLSKRKQIVKVCENIVWDFYKILKDIFDWIFGRNKKRNCHYERVSVNAYRYQPGI